MNAPAVVDGGARRGVDRRENERSGPDVGSVGGSGTLAIAVRGSYAFVGLGMRVVAVGLADPVRPVARGSAWLPGIPRGMVADGRWLDVAAGAAGLQVSPPLRAHAR